MNFEILAPAGSMEALIAGVRCGADAVYLGGKSLNARRNAGNFDDEALKAAIRYCRQRDVRVYLTVNTLVSDNEMNRAYDVVKTALQSGIDAFIVQDIGLAKVIKASFPDAVLHASTQMSVMTPSGARELEDMGFSRMVLPREMTKEEIREMRANTEMELELFVHGALCMSVSGQCYLSSMIGSRSGNRGLCAQPCRLPFSADGSGSRDLSLKDLSLLEELKEISACGVSSLKIEGRMKRPEYVAAAVTSLKKAVCGTYTQADRQTLRSVFSRSGFTKGYFVNQMDQDMFGTRRKEDVTSATVVLKELSRLYEKEPPRTGLDLELSFCRNQPVCLTAQTGKKQAAVTGRIPERAISKSLDREMLAARITKLGGTQYYANRVSIDLDEGLTLPAGEINALRRSLVRELDAQPEIQIKAKPFSPAPEMIFEKDNVAPYFTARFAYAWQIPHNHPFQRIFLPVWSSPEDFRNNQAGAELPRGLFGKEQELKKRLELLRAYGVTQVLCGNIGSYRLAKDMGFACFGDFGLNIFNSESARLISSPILSFELTLKQANCVQAKDTGIIGYGKLPLMLTRNCPVKNKTGCKKCGKKGVLTDRKGYRFPVVCSPYPCVEMLNCVPLYLGDSADEIHTDFIHFYFTDETTGQAEKIICMFSEKQRADFDYTRGLYRRGAQ